MPFTSDPSTHRQCFNVSIIDDRDVEDSERFILDLSLTGDSTVPINVIPNVSTVEITDDDGTEL